MIGSLNQFMETQESQCFQNKFYSPLKQPPNINNLIKKINHYKPLTADYHAVNKSQFLDRFNRKSIQIAKSRQFLTYNKSLHYQSNSKIRQTSIRAKPSYHMHPKSFFAKSIPDKDQISKNKQKYSLKCSLNKDHSLLKAIVKTQEAEANHRDNTSFDDCLKNLKDSFSQLNIKTQVRKHQFHIQKVEENPSIVKFKSKIANYQKNYKYKHKPSLKIKKIELNNCIRWAQKHNKAPLSFSKLLDTDWEAESKAKTQQIKILYENRKRILKKIDVRVRYYSFEL